jgi:hypothetical protein
MYSNETKLISCVGDLVRKAVKGLPLLLLLVAAVSVYSVFLEELLVHTSPETRQAVRCLKMRESERARARARARERESGTGGHRGEGNVHVRMREHTLTRTHIHARTYTHSEPG